MKGIFKFWGYNQDTWKRLTENQSLFALPSHTHETQSPEVSFGRVHFAPDLHKELGAFYDDVENGIMMPILHREDLPLIKNLLFGSPLLGALRPRASSIIALRDLLLFILMLMQRLIIFLKSVTSKPKHRFM